MGYLDRLPSTAAVVIQPGGAELDVIYGRWPFVNQRERQRRQDLPCQAVKREREGIGPSINQSQPSCLGECQLLIGSRA